MSYSAKRFARLAGAMLLVVVGQWIVAASNVHAAIVPWAIDSFQSSVTLAFPDQVVTISGFPVPLHVANQSGGSTWNDGNSSPLAGTILTDFTPTTIQFLPGGSNLFALPSGTYRPDPASFVGADYTTTGAAPANFGGKVEVATGAGDLMYFALDDITYDVASVPLAITPYNFLTTGVGFGMSSGTVLADGVSNPFPFGSLSDTLMPLTPTSGFAGSSIGAINFGVMTLDFTLHISIDFGNGIVLSGGAFGGDENPPASGSPPVIDGAMRVLVVAYQVPEPPARLLAVLAALGGPPVAALAASRKRRRRPSQSRR